jgi:hypothetical protein
MIVLAHAGHWLSGLVLVAPVVVIALLVLASDWRETRRLRSPPSPTGRSRSAI